jgi:membrane-bound hydrogenase subunit beta
VPEEAVVKKLESGLYDIATSVECKRDKRIFINVARENLSKAVKYVMGEYKTQHISTITALDAGDHLEVLYHVASSNKLFTFKVQLQKEDAWVNTLTGILPGAILYEREIHEIMGIKVRGHPDMRHLILPDSWENKGYPLRKDWVQPKKKEEGKK